MRATRSPARSWEQATQPTAARDCSWGGRGSALLGSCSRWRRRKVGGLPVVWCAGSCCFLLWAVREEEGVREREKRKEERRVAAGLGM